MYYQRRQIEKAKGVIVKVKKLPSIPYLLKKLQDTFNAYIRLRDAGRPCISCGSRHELQAGHFYSAGHFTGLRFNEDNVHVQCERCNCFLHGNLLAYREGLIKKIGRLRFEKLELLSQIKKTQKWSRFELELMLTYYQDKIKALK